MRLSEIQEQIGRGEYRVDTQAVADAIVRRLIQERHAGSPEHERDHGACS